MTQTHPSDADDALAAEVEAALAEEPWAATAMPMPALQGMSCAMAIGPDESPPPEWMHVALGVDDDVEIPEALAGRLERFRQQTEAAARARTLVLKLDEQRRGRLDYRTWCEGFVEGVELSPIGWYAASDPDEVDELLFPILVIADALDADERAAFRPDEWRRRLLDSERRLPETIARLTDYWAIVRSPPQTLRRDAPKVGRNDPCPCGSGRKFKQCHGR